MGAVSGWFRWELCQDGLGGSCFKVVQMGDVSGWFRWELFQGGLDESYFRVV